MCPNTSIVRALLSSQTYLPPGSRIPSETAMTIDFLYRRMASMRSRKRSDLERHLRQEDQVRPSQSSPAERAAAPVSQPALRPHDLYDGDAVPVIDKAVPDNLLVMEAMYLAALP